jgi:hypothetical protein
MEPFCAGSKNRQLEKSEIPKINRSRFDHGSVTFIYLTDFQIRPLRNSGHKGWTVRRLFQQQALSNEAKNARAAA